MNSPVREGDHRRYHERKKKHLCLKLTLLATVTIVTGRTYTLVRGHTSPAIETQLLAHRWWKIQGQLVTICYSYHTNKTTLWQPTACKRKKSSFTKRRPLLNTLLWKNSSYKLLQQPCLDNPFKARLHNLKWTMTHAAPISNSLFVRYDYYWYVKAENKVHSVVLTTPEKSDNAERKMWFLNWEHLTKWFQFRAIIAIIYYNVLSGISQDSVVVWHWSKKVIFCVCDTYLSGIKALCILWSTYTCF